VEKDLDLPARSRFGEGRAEPIIDLIPAPQAMKKLSFSVITKVTPNIPIEPQF